MKAQEAGEPFDAQDVLDPPPHVALATLYDTVAATGERPGRLPNRELRTQLVRLLLALDHQQYRSVVGDRLGALAPIDAASGLIADIMRATDRRSVSEWPRWLDPLDSGAIAADQTLQALVDTLALKLWQVLTGAEAPDVEQAQQAIAALARCGGGVSSQERLPDAVAERLDAPFASDDAVAQQATGLEQARALSNALLLDRGVLADIVLSAVAQTLQTAKPPAQPGQPATGTVEATILTRVHEEAQNASPEQLQSVLDASAASPWLSDVTRGNVQLVVASALRMHDAQTPAPLSIDELHALVPHLATEPTVDETLALALANFTATPDDAWRLVEPLADGELPPQTRSALSTFAHGLGSTRAVRLG